MSKPTRLSLIHIFWTYLADLNEQAADRLACIVSQMQEAEGVTEELKALETKLQGKRELRQQVLAYAKTCLLYTSLSFLYPI